MTKYRAMVEYLEAVAIEEGQRATTRIHRESLHRVKGGKQIDIFDNEEFRKTFQMLEDAITSYQKRRGTGTAL